MYESNNLCVHICVSYIDKFCFYLQEVKQKQDDELLANREEDEMDLSDTDDSSSYQPVTKKSRSATSGRCLDSRRFT